ncbi:MAG: hypothetical protein ACHQM6_05605 [Candidatus Kapaibacterium sp.]
MMNYESGRKSMKMHLISAPILLAILQLPSIVFAQEKQEAFTITNYFNPHYRDFQMMKISIIPPAGFAKDTDQVGFLDVKDAAAIRAEYKKQGAHPASSEFFKLFDSTGYNDSLGLKLLESYHFTINGYESHLVSLSGRIEGDDYLMWWMFIGDTSNTYIVKSFIPVKKKMELEQQVRTALLSVFYEPDRRLIPPGGDPTTTGTSSCNCHTKN